MLDLIAFKDQVQYNVLVMIYKIVSEYLINVLKVGCKTHHISKATECFPINY